MLSPMGRLVFIVVDALLGLASIGSIIGNLRVLCLIFSSKKLRNNRNLQVVGGLAAVDFAIAFTFVPYVCVLLYYEITGEPHYGFLVLLTGGPGT